MDYKEKISLLNKVRQEFKKKRFILDEGKSQFGMESMELLHKVRNKSEIKGYPFKIKPKNLKIKDVTDLAIKVMPLQSIFDKETHPSNLENLILKELTENLVNKGVSPHITHYIATQKVPNKCKALKFLNLKRLEAEEYIRSHSNLLISEYVSGGSLDEWVEDKYDREEGAEPQSALWKYITFCILYTLDIMQTKYRLMHNDLHFGNILVDTSIKDGYFVYTLRDKTYYFRNYGVLPLLWDLEFAMMYSDKMSNNYPNKLIIGECKYDKRTHTTIFDPKALDDDEFNVPYNYNEIYDVHYFLTSLLDLYISNDLFDWITELYPTELIPPDDSTTEYSSGTSRESGSQNESVSEENEESESSDTEGTENESSGTDDTDDTNSSDPDNRFLCSGRLVNGTEALWKLPTTKSLIESGFFDEFLIKPQDFDENTAVYFNAGY